MLRRILPVALAALACVFAVAGAASLAHLTLLVAIPAAAGGVLDAVSARVAQRAGLLDLILAALGLGLVVAGAAVRAPFIALGAVATFIPALALPDLESPREVRLAAK